VRGAELFIKTALQSRPWVTVLVLAVRPCPAGLLPSFMCNDHDLNARQHGRGKKDQPGAARRGLRGKLVRVGLGVEGLPLARTACSASTPLMIRRRLAPVRALGCGSSSRERAPTNGRDQRARASAEQTGTARVRYLAQCGAGDERLRTRGAAVGAAEARRSLG